MAFPTTSVLDNFNRSDETPLTGWSSIFGVAGRCEVASNACEADAANANDYWNATTFGPDSEVFCTVVTKPSNAQSMEMYVRLQAVGSVAADGYALRLTVASGAGNDAIGIYRVDNAVATLLDTAFTQEVNNGDSIGLEVVGSTLTAYYKAAAGSWTALGTRSDSTYTGAGHIGLAIANANVARIDDFGGGTVVAAVTIEPSVGSTPMTGRTPTIAWTIGMPNVP